MIQTWLLIILPPLVGAVIGYVTNAIAISMLFRPHYEIRVFGVRLPFTPGILPRQRGQLAESIAQMVSTKLLTKDAVAAQTESSDFHKTVSAGVSGITQGLLDTPVEQLMKPGSENQNSIGRLVRKIVSESVHSEGFALFAESLAGHLALGLGKLKPQELMPVNSSSLGRNIVNLLLTSGTRDAVVEQVHQYIDKISTEGRTVGDYISEQQAEAIIDFIDRIYPDALKLILRWLRRDTTKAELEIRGRKLLREIIDKLNNLQRFVISAGQYDRSLEKSMDKIVADLIHTVEAAGTKEENRRQLISHLQDEINSLRARDIGLILRENPKLMGGIDSITAAAMNAVISEKGRETVGGLLTAFTNVGNRSIHELMDAAGIDRNALQNWITKAVINTLCSLFPENNETGAAGAAIAAAFTESMGGGRSLGDIISLDPKTKKELDEAVAGKLVDLVNQKVPQILETMNVHDMVVDKINSLDVAQVESLLLMVIKKHLKWINVFGALLGSIIGFVQVAGNWLARGSF